MALTNGPNLGVLVDGAIGEEHYSELMAQWRGLDGLIQPNAISATTSAQPGSPSDGDVYLVPSGATGAAWSGQDGKVARYSATVGAWEFFTPRHGWVVYVRDVDLLLAWGGIAWNVIAGLNPYLRRQYAAVGTSDDTPATLLTIPLPTSTQCSIIEVNVLAKDGPPNLATFRLVASFKNTGGTVTQVGNKTEVHKEADVAIAAVTAEFVISGTNVIVEVTGIAATSITWVGRATITDN